jgi:hypothetical protein
VCGERDLVDVRTRLLAKLVDGAMLLQELATRPGLAELPYRHKRSRRGCDSFVGLCIEDDLAIAHVRRRFRSGTNGLRLGHGLGADDRDAGPSSPSFADALWHPDSNPPERAASLDRACAVARLFQHHGHPLSHF